MRFLLGKTTARFSVFAIVSAPLAALADGSQATQVDPDKAPKYGQYVYDSFGRNARSGLSESCVDTGFWDPLSATLECDPNLFASRAAPKARTSAHSESAPRSVVEAAPIEPYARAHYEDAAAPTVSSQAAPVAKTKGGSQVAKAKPESNLAKAVPVSNSAKTEPRSKIAKPAFAAGVAMPEPQSSVPHNELGSRVARSEPAFTSKTPVPPTDTNGPENADDRISGPVLFYEEEHTPLKDDGILSRNRYYDEEGGRAKGEGIVGKGRHDDENGGVARADGLTALSQNNEEEKGAARKNDITAHSTLGNEDAGRSSENLLGEPRVIPHEERAAAEKPQAISILPVTITVEADPLFDFNRSAVRDDSRKKLDDLIAQLHRTTYGEIIIVGFADPIGTAIYNQSLSWRRAESVEHYLVKNGLPASRMRAEGRGETEEYASYQSCGGLRNAQSIACLQPDRRVEVTITATEQP